MINLDSVKTIYFIGIKGVAMSGLAVICKERGIAVYGSDVSEKFITDKILSDAGISVFETFAKENLDCAPDAVVVGASWDDSNVEVAEAINRGINVISESSLRGVLSLEKRTIAVTGVHGKTTTTALLAHIFKAADREPSYLVGTGRVPDLGTNAAWTSGKHFIVEGDEYIKSKLEKDPKFLDLAPAVSIITSIEWEHVDVYPDVTALEYAFRRLVDQTGEYVVGCGDWESVRNVTGGTKKKIITYGFDKENIWQARDIVNEFDGTQFRVTENDTDHGIFSIKLFGEHNVLNALAAIIVSLQEGIGIQQVRTALSTFRGTERRFDVSERNGITFVDDYAHHPTAVKTTLAAIKHRYPDKKIWCVFQPHMASRTKAFLSEFAQSFENADRVIFADIFASARESSADITSKELAEETKRHHSDVVYAGSLNDVIAFLKSKISKETVIVTMGAGDVYRVRDKLLS